MNRLLISTLLALTYGATGPVLAQPAPSDPLKGICGKAEDRPDICLLGLAQSDGRVRVLHTTTGNGIGATIDVFETCEPCADIPKPPAGLQNARGRVVLISGARDVYRDGDTL
jgi:hypothetical protein